MQDDEDMEQSCEDIADSSLPAYTTPDAGVTGGEDAVGDGVGVGGGGGVGGRGGGVGDDQSRRRPSDGGSVTRKKKKNEVGGAAWLHRALDEITEVLRSQCTVSDPPG